MKLVYTNESPLLVGHAKNLVEGQGISTTVKNEFVGSGFGELSGADTWPELWVMDESDYAKAAEIIEGMIFESAGKDWLCRSCKEENGAAFDYCWSCQKAKRPLAR